VPFDREETFRNAEKLLPILKIEPDEENSMLQLGDLSAKQGLMVESRAHSAHAFRAGLEPLKIQTGGAAC